MDPRRFDTLTVQIASRLTRRQVMKGMAGGALGIVVGDLAAQTTGAQACAGITDSCAAAECCEGFTCNENDICIAIAECADLGGGCQAHEQCCEGYFCGDTGICIAAAECVSEGGGCEVDENCCDDRVCGEDGLCAGVVSADVTLPNTGVYPGESGPFRIAASAAVIGSAALAAGALLRRDRSLDTN